jgi:hypothetical protein
MVLGYDSVDHFGPGKASEDTDIVQGRFVELLPDCLACRSHTGSVFAARASS